MTRPSAWAATSGSGARSMDTQEYAYRVENIETGEVLAQFDSRHLAVQMVHRINMACGRKRVTLKPNF
jgi:hypothetical protein